MCFKSTGEETTLPPQKVKCRYTVYTTVHTAQKQEVHAAKLEPHAVWIGVERKGESERSKEVGFSSH